ncbi:conserved oligomeric Golgi complex subunit 8 [Tribolium castaneum]|uniref:Conserved oligomeric Golgi complex subunit 8 n=1 Tax=Tribolium castaneum TaxID=7070 RepID=D2A1E2_TRICA|nr:PREDICTED: conserved oligomeric Golgi complex subunit 8 [Tribolium castaneum]EFA02659.1 Conserved oligomeric Golgi complex subunit 8-like Protein [Tribolium castaneum]|eukprot:XP_975406.1 PREDICTED: conserved oligomeric Golgi complex subunit 8 [Tribolium castaneum]
MSDETSNLLKLVFPNGFPSAWEYSTAFSDYISRLGTYKVEDLSREPARLNEEKASIHEQTQELAVTNYKTFIETAQCSRDLFTQFNTIEEKLDNLLEDIPEFEKKCQLFGEETSGINNLRRLNSLTLTRNAQLLEILELPQLMNSFINDGLYEDALELASYVRKLHNKHPDVPIFKSIVADVDKAWLLMLHQLLTQLKQELTLPKCLQIVSHLRRMQVFTESELRLKFLQTRNTWLQSCLNAIPKDNANYHLNKTIEVTRVNLFNIITQYRAIFNDDEHSPLASIKSQQVNQNVIFFTWIRDKISDFLATLEHDLNQGVSSIDTILAQCMYFGVSFSKVGCDFRSSLIPIFTNKIVTDFENAINDAIKRFELNMERFTLINKNHSNVPWKNKNEDPLQPPDSLLEFYPIAEFLNNVLTALNELKLCAPIAAAKAVVDSLQHALLVIAKSILVLHGQEQQAFTANAKDAFTRLCMCFADDLVPYIQKCVHIIFPPSNIATVLGVNVQVLQNEGLTFLNKDVIVDPIRHLLPVKITPVLDLVESETKIEASDNRNELTSE